MSQTLGVIMITTILCVAGGQGSSGSVQLPSPRIGNSTVTPLIASTIPTQPPARTSPPITSAQPTQVAPTTVVSATPASSDGSSITPRTGHDQDAWLQTRTTLPENVPVYKPSFVPARFAQTPVVERLRVDDNQSNGPLYQIVYTEHEEKLVFLMVMGDATDSHAPPSQTETITVVGQEGVLIISTVQPTYQVVWSLSKLSYAVQLYGTHGARDEIIQIVQSLAPML